MGGDTRIDRALNLVVGCGLANSRILKPAKLSGVFSLWIVGGVKLHRESLKIGRPNSIAPATEPASTCETRTLRKEARQGPRPFEPRDEAGPRGVLRATLRRDV